ncbi:MAG: D-2-hydroxyacid dehydrogenase [Planctomycetes bacterium]|nr:D-2-hydroxyacid dehydrogenase [Planctomycetota bacterium]
MLRDRATFRCLSIVLAMTVWLAAAPAQRVHALPGGSVAEVATTARGAVNVAWLTLGDRQLVFDPAFPEGLLATAALRGTARETLVVVLADGAWPESSAPPDPAHCAIVHAGSAHAAHFRSRLVVGRSVDVLATVTTQRIVCDGRAAFELDAGERFPVSLHLRAVGDTATRGAGLVACVPAPALLCLGPLGVTPDAGAIAAAPDPRAWRAALAEWSDVRAPVVPLRGPVDERSPIAGWLAALDREPAATAPDRTALGSLRGACVALPVDPAAPPPLRILVRPLPAAIRERLHAAAPNVTLVEARDAAAALAAAPTVHAADAAFCSDAFVAAATRLRWAQAWSAGVERVLAVQRLRDDDAIVLTNMRGASGATIAEHAFGLLLALTRDLGAHRDAQRESRWAPQAGRARDELAGSTLLVLGLGGIGTAVARRAAAFEMRVLAVDVATEPRPDFVERIAPPAELDAVLPEADVVVVCLPLTDATRGLLDARRLALLPRGALLINVSRGAIVDTAALVAALDAGRLGGAGLDVVDPEPLPASHPLWARPDVVVTPHVSGSSRATDEREADLFVENVRRFAHGEPLLNVVDKRAGY